MWRRIANPSQRGRKSHEPLRRICNPTAPQPSTKLDCKQFTKHFPSGKVWLLIVLVSHGVAKDYKSFAAGFIRSNREVSINKLNGYENLKGLYKKSEFDIKLQSGVRVFVAKNVEDQSFQIYDLHQRYVGFARMLSRIVLD